MAQLAGLWRRTPPAIFPPIFGLFGLGLAWRAGAPLFGLPAGLAEMILGAVTLLYLFALVAWLAKPLRRPSAVLDELRVLPGRAGLASMSLSLMLLAAVLGPYSAGLASVVALTALGLHLLLAGLLVRVMLSGPPEGRVVTPVWHVSFVGFILFPFAALPLGFAALGQGIAILMIPFAGFVWLVSAWQLATRVPPAPLRPLLAIHLAPASVLAVVWAMLGAPVIAGVFATLAAAILLALVVMARWVMAAGFSPLWGAFTFPLAAFGAALLAVSEWAPWLRVPAGLALVGATLVIPPIAVAVLREWARGGLAAKTNAAQV